MKVATPFTVVNLESSIESSSQPPKPIFRSQSMDVEPPTQHFRSNIGRTRSVTDDITGSSTPSGTPIVNVEMSTDNRSDVKLIDLNLSKVGPNSTTQVNYGIPNVLNTGPIPYFNVVNIPS
ncbi:hypothetical protein Tco_0262457 [Tanacetum coccineum]